MSTLNVAASLNFTKNGTDFRFSSRFTNKGLVGFLAIKNVQTIGITDETLLLGDVTDIGYVLITNMNLGTASPFVSIGPTTSNYPLTLVPGASSIFRWNAGDIHAKSDTAPAIIGYTIIIGS